MPGEQEVVPNAEILGRIRPIISIYWKIHRVLIELYKLIAFAALLVIVLNLFYRQAVYARSIDFTVVETLQKIRMEELSIEGFTRPEIYPLLERLYIEAFGCIASECGHTPADFLYFLSKVSTKTHYVFQSFTISESPILDLHNA